MRHAQALPRLPAAHVHAQPRLRRAPLPRLLPPPGCWALLLPSLCQPRPLSSPPSPTQPQAVAAQPGVAGYVVAGLGTGESPDQRRTIIAEVVARLPPAAPRMASGLGCPEEVLEAVSQVGGWGVRTGVRSSGEGAKAKSATRCMHQKHLQPVYCFLPRSAGHRHVFDSACPPTGMQCCCLNCITTIRVRLASPQGVDMFDSSYVAGLVAGGYALCFPVSPGDEAAQAAAAAAAAAAGPAAAGGTTAAGGDAATAAAAAAEAAAGAGQDDGRLNLWALAYRADKRPLLPGCSCFTCAKHTRAYVHHLLQAHEMTAQVGGLGVPAAVALP